MTHLLDHIRRRINVRRGMPGRMARTMLLFIILAGAMNGAIATLFTLNASWSAPHWGYARLPASLWPFGIERGDWIQFIPPVDAPWPYIKQVRGVAGDMVSVTGSREVLVNGRFVGHAGTHALTGRPVEPITSGVIPPGHLFVIAPHPRSHDSRYAEIGLIPESAVIGRVRPLPDIPWLGLDGPLTAPERLMTEASDGP